jgi:hypothetical protein
MLTVGGLWCGHKNRYGRVENRVVKTAKKHWREVGVAAATIAGIVLGAFIGHRAGVSL